MSRCSVYVGCLCGAYPRVTFYGTPNDHLVQTLPQTPTRTMRLLQSECMCCYHTIGTWSLFRVQLDTRMWFLQVQNAFLGTTQTLEGAYAHSEPDYIIAVRDWNDLHDLRVWSVLEDLTLIIWRRLALGEQRIQCTWSANTCRLAWKVLYNYIHTVCREIGFILWQSSLYHVNGHGCLSWAVEYNMWRQQCCALLVVMYSNVSYCEHVMPCTCN